MKVLILSPIDPAAVERLRRDHDVLSAVGAEEAVVRTLIRDRQVLVFRSGVTLSAALLEAAPQLRLLIRAGSGLDNIDVEYVTRHEIELVRIPEPGARAVAELTFGLMLALARNIPRADTQLRRGKWVKHSLPAYLLRDRVLGIVGAGNIGVQVGKLGVAWGMTVVGCVKHPSIAVAARLEQAGMRLAGFDEVVESADFLSVHVPLTDSTRHLINADVLPRMKPGSFLLNLARGGVVDEHALRAALLSGARLRGAALDVHETEGDNHISPLADLPNVVLTPHIGATTVDTQREIGERIVSIIESATYRTHLPASGSLAPASA